MEYGKADVVTQAVAMVDAEAVKLAQSLYANPQPYLDGKLTALRGQTKQMVTLALVRLAVRDPDAAADAAEKLRWRTQLTEEERSWVWSVIGKRLAQRLSPDALEAFGHARDEYLDEEHLAWKARAAIRAGSWAQVSSTISAMGERQRREPTWVYWQAKALQAKGDSASRQNAFLLLRQISGTDGFYEQLALEALGNDVTVPPSPAPLTETEKSAARQDEGLQRALKAIAIGLRSEGVREWNYTVALHSPGGMSERELLAAADLACQHQVWDRCINTSARTGNSIDHAQRYPTPYRQQVVQRAREINLDPAYVYGLIRQESRFVMDARSGVGASGLMQVMPATAKWTAKRIGLVNFKPHHISDRDTNITIGTAYLKLALDDFEGSMALAAAAYNAGPSRARAWRDGPTLDAAAWIENIPFDETRDYVKRVLANTTNYAAVLTGEPQRLSARLAPIGPRPTSSPATNDDLP
jgi:soluble lytic murein transglycosylase